MKMIVKHCLFCRAQEQLSDLYPRTFEEKDLTPAVFSARRETEHFHYQMVRCRGCGLVFSREILPDTILLDLYSKSSVTFGEHADVLRRDYWRPLERHLSGLPRSAALEIGCSSGFFLQELKKQGFLSVVGSEPSLEAKQKADLSVRDCIQSGFFDGQSTFPPHRFDLVCLFQTIDHLTEPQTIMKSIREVLLPGGLVYLICHNAASLQARLLGSKSPIIDIEHIYLFNKKTLSRLLTQAGLDIVVIGDLENSYPLDYWLYMLPIPMGLKSFVSSLFKLTGLGRLSPALKAGNIYAIAREPKQAGERP